MDFAKDDITGLAAEMAYRLLFAFFPFLIFLAALVGFISATVGYANLFNVVMASIALVVPPEIERVISDWVAGVLSTRSPGLMTFGAAGALWGGSGGVGTLIKGLNRAYGVSETRPFWVVQTRALIATVALTVVMIGGVSLYSLGRRAGEWLAELFDLGQGFIGAWNASQRPFVAIGLGLALLLCYRALPNASVTVRQALPGTVTATVGWVILTVGFSSYVDHFGSYDKTFGSLGAAVVLMLWMYAVGIILLAGGEVNAVAARLRGATAATGK